MKKIFKLLTLWDGFWSIPLAFVSFLAYEIFGRWMFGTGFGAYDPSYFQAAIMAGAIVVITNFIVQAALKFNFPKAWRIYKNESLTDQCGSEEPCNYFEKLTPTQQVCATIFLYCFFSLEYIIVFLKIV